MMIMKLQHLLKNLPNLPRISPTWASICLTATCSTASCGKTITIRNPRMISARILFRCWSNPKRAYLHFPTQAIGWLWERCNPTGRHTWIWYLHHPPHLGLHLFYRDPRDRVPWGDQYHKKSPHDFGQDIIPLLVKSKARIFAFPYSGYWMDVGTVQSYWQAHMDLLSPSPPLKLYDRSWVMHTRAAEQPPARIPANAHVYASMISSGCFIESGARVESCVLSPGVIIKPGAIVRE